jgi:hypothetical protein
MRRIKGYWGNTRKKEAIMVLVGNTLALLLPRWEEMEKNNLHNFYTSKEKSVCGVLNYFWYDISGLWSSVLFDFLAVKQAKIKPQDEQPTWEEAWF